MAHDSTSAIISFISRLTPLYVGENRYGVLFARSLTDGTLIGPSAEDVGEGRVWVSWQGNPERRTAEQATHLAQLAIGRYVQFHSTDSGAGAAAAARKHLIEHFYLKTGERLETNEEDSLVDLLAATSRLVDKLGTAAAIEALKKAFFG